MLSTTDSEDHDELIAKADPEREDIVQQLSSVYNNLLSAIGEDPTRQGLKKTPERAAKALWYFTHGYHVKLSGNLFVFSKLFTLLLSFISNKQQVMQPIDKKQPFFSLFLSVKPKDLQPNYFL
jgi:hypothetical protein